MDDRILNLVISIRAMRDFLFDLHNDMQKLSQISQLKKINTPVLHKRFFNIFFIYIW